MTRYTLAVIVLRAAALVSLSGLVTGLSSLFFAFQIGGVASSVRLILALGPLVIVLIMGAFARPAGRFLERTGYPVPRPSLTALALFSFIGLSTAGAASVAAAITYSASREVVLSILGLDPRIPLFAPCALLAFVLAVVYFELRVPKEIEE